MTPSQYKSLESATNNHTSVQCCESRSRRIHGGFLTTGRMLYVRATAGHRHTPTNPPSSLLDWELYIHGLDRELPRAWLLDVSWYCYTRVSFRFGGIISTYIQSTSGSEGLRLPFTQQYLQTVSFCSCVLSHSQELGVLSFSSWSGGRRLAASRLSIS